MCLFLYFFCLFLESLLQISGWHPPQVRTRREILSEMQKVALFKLESYWLPNFYIHCKLSMELEPKCLHLLEEYVERLCRAGLPRLLSPPPPMSIRKSSPQTLSYCSLKNKKEIWAHIRGYVSPPKSGKRKKGESLHVKRTKRSVSSPHGKKKHKGGGSRQQKKSKSPEGSPTDKKQQPSEKLRLSSDKTEEETSDIEEDFSPNESPSFKSSPSDFHTSPTSDDLPETSIVRKLRSSTPMVAFPSMLHLRTVVSSPLTLAFLPWVLIAEKCAGRPFREYLLRKGCSVEVHLLDLWHDLEDFLRMMMCSLGEGNILLRHVMGERICELYLVQSSNWHLPLKLTTLKSLQNLLPSGHVIPWVLKAQKEICQVGKSA